MQSSYPAYTSFWGLVIKSEMVGALRTEILQPGTLIQNRSHWTAMAFQPGGSLHSCCHIIL